MSAAVKTSVTELPESRVRVEAEVPPEEIERRMQATARQLGQNLRMPGFRKGKVPPPVVIQRIGRESVLDETVRGAMGRWYLDAIDAAGIHPVGDPELDVGDLPGEGQPLTFTIEIGVRPTATPRRVQGRRGRQARAGRRRRGRERRGRGAARAQRAPGDRRGAAADKGDFVVMDYVGSIDGENFAGGEGRDQLVELGSGRLVPGFEDQLMGAKAGDERTVTVDFPDDYGAAELAGKQAAVRGHASRRSSARTSRRSTTTSPPTPPASTPSPSCARTSRPSCARPTRRAWRPSSAKPSWTPSSSDSQVDVPAALVDARAQELWERMLHSLSHQGISKEAYLRIAGREESEILEEAKPDAEQALRREAVIAAVVEAEGIEASEGDILDALQTTAARERTTPEKLRAGLEKSGRLDDLREDLAQRAAIDLLAESATPISVEQAQARDKLWTPGRQGSDDAPARLWTPGARD